VLVAAEKRSRPLKGSQVEVTHVEFVPLAKACAIAEFSIETP
jgi:hypothetical protein